MTSRGASITSDGTNTGNFATQDWLLLGTVSLIWGSSFLWIAISLESLHPAAIALIRTALGAVVVWSFAPARQPVARHAWPAITGVAIFGNAAPALFFPFAQERVDSSVAGMLNSTSPILVLIISVALLRKLPLRKQLMGLAVGLLGALFMAWPNVTGADAEPFGVLLVFFAILGYATSNNLLPPLQQAWGGPAVIARALALSAVLLLPYGAWGLTQSTFSWGPVIAVTILGVAGTGIARSLFATLVGSVGAPRSSMVGYFVPVTAIALGVLVRGESIGPLELFGTALVLLSAWMISRGRAARAATDAAPVR